MNELQNLQQINKGLEESQLGKLLIINTRLLQNWFAAELQKTCCKTCCKFGRTAIHKMPFINELNLLQLLQNLLQFPCLSSAAKKPSPLKEEGFLHREARLKSEKLNFANHLATYRK